jgi:hypothetical protein
VMSRWVDQIKHKIGLPEILCWRGSGLSDTIFILVYPLSQSGKRY